MNSSNRICLFLVNLLFLSVMLCCTNSSSLAGEHSAIISAVRGEVSAIDINGVTRKLKVNDIVKIAENIFTGAGSKVKIIFKDNTIITLGEKSSVRLDRYIWEKKKQRGRFEITVKEGVFRIIGGTITKTTPKKFKTRTPAATIGIRGSSFGGKIVGNSLKVYLESGKGIDVYNSKGSVALLVPGMGTTVESADSAPAMGVQFPSKFIEAIMQQTMVSQNDSGGGSQIGPNGVVTNRAAIKNSANVAQGKGNLSNMGSVSIRESIIKGSVTNDAEVENATNVSSGTNNSATMSGIVVE